MSKVALVVGGTGGLGAACAEDLAKDHSIVIIAGRNAEKGDALVQKIAKAGGKAAFSHVNVADEESVATLHGQIMDKYGRLDVAVNAHGVVDQLQPLAESTKDGFQQCMDINVTGTYLCMKEQVKVMQQQEDKDRGQIVNFSSIYGLTGCKYGAIYSATKHAVIGLTRSAAVDHPEIRINALAPGFIPTELTSAIDPTQVPDGDLKDFLAAMPKAYPRGLTGQPADCARAVRYLVESPWVTGTVMEIDGGFGAKRQ